MQIRLFHGPCDGGLANVDEHLKRIVIPQTDRRRRPSRKGYRNAVYCEAFDDVWCFAGYEDEATK